jgi:hypothetical protein
MSVKEQVLEILNDDKWGDDEFCDKFYQAKNKIQAIPDEVTLREVKEWCEKKRCINCQFNYEDRWNEIERCDLIWNMVLQSTDWDIDEITKAIRGSE